MVLLMNFLNLSALCMGWYKLEMRKILLTGTMELPFNSYLHTWVKDEPLLKQGEYQSLVKLLDKSVKSKEPSPKELNFISKVHNLFSLN